MGGKSKRTAGLRTSREIHDRIRWDPTLDELSFVVGYEERFAGRQERPFAEFPTDGEIPWHRVWYYRVGSLRVWCREERIDLLFGSGQTERAQVERVKAAIEAHRSHGAGPVPATAPGLPPLTPVPLHRFSDQIGAWMEHEALPPPPPQPSPRVLTVVTYNILQPKLDAGPPPPEHRLPALFEVLRHARADLIALQEVTPPVLEALRALPWVRRDYAVTDEIEATSVRPYGQVLLARAPLRPVRASLRLATRGGHKRWLRVELRLRGQPLHVLVLHLPSDRTRDAPRLRQQQLGSALHDLDALGPGAALVLGDLNADRGQLDEMLTHAGFEDLWSSLRPGDAGLTFDPGRNPLAARASRTGRARRLDRIALRAGGAAGLVAADIERLGTDPVVASPQCSGFVSDHFGLRARLRFEMPAEAPAPPSDATVHRSAVALMPPRALWPSIQQIRREHDRAFARWMPHINLLYGFVPEASFDRAAAVIEQVLRDVPPFRIRLRRLGRFPRRGGATVWLEPETDPPEALPQLQAALQAAFAQCTEQSRHGGFTPHLTVGQLPQAALPGTIERWQADWSAIEWSVDTVALLARNDDAPFSVRHLIPLGGMQSRPRPTPEAPAPALLPSLVRAFTECVEALGGTRARLELVGSHRLGVATEASDLDVVGLSDAPCTTAALFQALPEHLRAQGHTVRARAALDAEVPRLALVVDGKLVDVQHVRWPAERPWPQPGPLVLPPATEAALDPTSHDALLAVLDVHALLDHAVRHGWDRFVGALGHLRRWARARRIDANAMGFPGGLAWAVMLAETAARLPEDPSAEDPALVLFEATIVSLAARTAHDWARDPIALPTVGPEHTTSLRDGPMVVLAPALPARNCMRRATSSTVATVEAELQRARALLSDATAAESLVSAVDPVAAHPWVLAIELSAPDPDSLDRLHGFVLGRLRTLLRSLERDLATIEPHARPTMRPYASPWPTRPVEGQTSTTYLVGLDLASTPPSLPERPLRDFEQNFSGWPERPSGTSVRLSVVEAAVMSRRLYR